MNSRVIEIDEQNSLQIIQDSTFGYAGEVWDAALVLNHFIINRTMKHPLSIENKVILELGAGTGSCGLISAMKGAKKVYLTDKEENLQILKRNYETNKYKIPTEAEVIIVPLDWSKKEDYSNVKDKIDLIICSDIVWNVKYFDDLIQTLSYFSQPNHTEILMAYQYRQKTDLEFFDKLKLNKFRIEKIADSCLDDDYKSDDIFLVIIRKLGPELD